jgi:hypothetical protein
LFSVFGFFYGDSKYANMAYSYRVTYWRSSSGAR